MQMDTVKIRRMLGDLVKAFEAGQERHPQAATRKGRSLHITPAGLAQLKLQGKYMGYMRQLNDSQKAQVRRVKEKLGLRRAAARAKELAGKWH